AYAAHTVQPWKGPVLLIRSAAEAIGHSGWEGTLFQLKEVVVPGDHRTIIHSGAVEAVAEHIALALTELEPAPIKLD
ncbi:MAG TPA: hypothetical protein PK760_08850, partial [Flavobacteriales bacterium]|nr:hypothetical protein [Flavobacteriales bacterium]